MEYTGTIRYGTVRYGMVWYGMVWYGMVWYGMVWYGMVWYGMVWYGMVWYGMVWYGMVWYGMVWYGMVWNGMVWYGMVWYGMVWYGIPTIPFCAIIFMFHHTLLNAIMPVMALTCCTLHEKVLDTVLHTALTEKQRLDQEETSCSTTSKRSTDGVQP